MKPPRQLAFALAVLLLSAATLPAAEADAPHSVTIPAWAFDRGNARTFTEEWADAEPMVAFGGRSPVEVEYDIEFPAAGEYRVRIHYAAASPRPVALLVDGHETAQVCRAATGSWNTSRAKADEPVTLSLTAGRHTLGLHRAGDFPHIVSLRLESVSPLATPWKLHRPQARKLTDAAPGTFEHRPDPKPLRLAIEDLNATFGAKYPRGPEYLRRLAELEKAHAAEPKSETVNRALRALQREALLANPLFDFDRLLVLKRVPTAPARRAMGDSLGVGSLNAFTSDTIPRQGQFRDELAVMSNVRGEPVLKTIYAPANGETVIDPVLHFDATRLLFAQNGAKQKNWRLWEMNLDGSGRHQITPDDGADIGHFDPCHLPDGRILFASTASYQGLPCVFGGQAMTCLFLLDPKTRNIRQLTFEQDSDWCPTMLPNGRVMYLRWEYTDQSHANSRILFHMNPDGTDQRELRGSGSWFPGSFFHAKPIPGEAHQIIGIAGGHHGTPRSGRLLIMDPTRGRRDAEGIVQEIPGRGRPVEPIVRDRLVDGVWPQFLMPAPLSAKHHIVAAKLGPDSLWGVYLADVFDNLTLIAEVEGAALLWPAPVVKREPPPVIQDRVKPDTDTCSVFITDVNAGPACRASRRAR